MPNSPEPTPKIFISYAWKNQTTAKRLQSDLKGDGVEVFVDYEKISGGDSLPERISAALDWCNTLVLLWSADSAESYYVKQEWSSAFHLQKKIIACVLDGTKLPALLSGNLYLNFTPYETGYAQLCRSLGVVPKPSIEKTAPPEPPKHVEMPVPQPPEEKRKGPPPAPPQRKSFTETLRRKPKPPDPAPVLKPPEVFNETKNDDADATEMTTPTRWSRRKIISAVLALIVLAAIAVTWQVVRQDSTRLTLKPTTVGRFRDKPDILSYKEVKIILERNDFYCREYEWSVEWSNPLGRGFANQFEKQQNSKVVYDYISRLMWEQSGSSNSIIYADAEKYITDLNSKKFASHSDWRLPTLDEAMSLMEPKEPNGDLYVDFIFDRKQQWIWTADKLNEGVAWVVNFNSGSCVPHPTPGSRYVRAVRSGQSVL